MIIKKFLRNDRAVSPVIGVILMVAITVVLAAVVFVMVGDLGQESSPSPQASFQNDRAGVGGEVVVIKVGKLPIQVEDLSVNPSSCVLKDVGGTAKTTGTLAAGDYYDCPNDGSISIVDQASNTLIYSGNI